MILSRKKKFVFIHIPKTAGTSITKLIMELVPDASELITYSKHPLLTHVSSRQVLKYLEEETNENPSDYQFFCFTRNPFERLHSLYHFIHHRWPEKLEGKDLNQWLFNNEEIYEERQTVPGEKPVPSTRKPQLDWMTVSQISEQNGTATLPKIIPSFIGRYENLREDLEDILYQLGLGDVKKISDVVKFKLDKLQNYHRDKDYRKYYNGQGRAWVDKFFEVDLEYFGYRF